MIMLFSAVVTTSFFDSLNPSAIVQQLLLQAMVKNKRHIWFFILGIGTANFALGMAIYYGLAQWIAGLIDYAANTFPVWLYSAALIGGLFCSAAGATMLYKTSRGAKPDDKCGFEGKTPARLSPCSLFLLGAVFCAVELTSAFPYFGFLALLTSYNPHLAVVLLFVLIYDLIYVLPLILLYFGYNRLKNTAAIKKIEAVLSRVSAYIVPAAVTILGGFLLYYSLCGLI